MADDDEKSLDEEPADERSEEETPEDDPWAFQWPDGAFPDRELQRVQLGFLLRKWAAFELYDATITAELSGPGPVTPIPVTFEEPKSNPNPLDPWTIHDDGVALRTGRPNLFAEYAGLYPLMQTIKQMIALSVEKGWSEVGFFGYGADYAWVEIHKHNLLHPDQQLQITNYEPENIDYQRYEKLLLEVATQAQLGF